MENSKIIETIKKCLSLAGNNPNSQEAESAALMAQKLMAKNNFTLADIGDNIGMLEEEVSSTTYTTGTGMKWKLQLLKVVSDNFRCKSFIYGKSQVAFYGNPSDIEIAKEVFIFLLTTGHKNAMKERARVKKITGSGDGVYNSYTLGFLAGLKQKLGEQCQALKLVVSEKVETEYKEFIKGSKSIKSNVSVTKYHEASYNSGLIDGRSATTKKALA